ncbi:carboxymuconolactone decarboxylase family protein [uncultured Clostridium sp.]|uniref:carboxymuconolactone decarboxylase family protein n=1 Tax=uncultured Clostridium sp. TaxID=59620 RepID=UPI0032170DC5
MAKINFSNEGTTPFEQLLGYNKGIMRSWINLERDFLQSTTFDYKLKEEVRRTLAHNNGCKYCMAKGKPSEDIEDRKIIMATKVADMISKNISLSEGTFRDLNELFSAKEISELFALICFFTASQKFGFLLDLEPSCLI